MNTLPSSAYSSLPSSFHAMVVSNWFFATTGLGAGVHEQEAAGAVGVLGHAGGPARLAEERGLLVAGDAAIGTPRRGQGGTSP
jgi:hypothetical protein